MTAIDIKDLVALLAERIDRLVPELLPGARLDGGAGAPNWEVGSIEGEAGQSLKIARRGVKRGWWVDFAGYDKGDALDLVAAVKFGGDRREAVKWARGWLGLDSTDPAALRAQRARARRRREKAEAQAARELEKNRGRALALWLEGEAQLRGTPVDLYLRGRGIELERLGKCPGALRYHPAVWCAEAQAKLPAMLARIQAPDGRHLAVHRTWLALKSGGGAVKARLKDPRKSWPAYAGGIIPLWRGESGLPLKAAAAAGLVETLCLTEGIEDGLSVALARPDWRVAAAVSLTNLRNLHFPGGGGPGGPNITDIVLCKDNDWGNDAARRALDEGVAALVNAGHAVRIAESPVGKDFNDLLRGKAG